MECCVLLLFGSSVVLYPVSAELALAGTEPAHAAHAAVSEARHERGQGSFLSVWGGTL